MSGNSTDSPPQKLNVRWQINACSTSQLNATTKTTKMMRRCLFNTIQWCLATEFHDAKFPSSTGEIATLDAKSHSFKAVEIFTPPLS